MNNIDRLNTLKEDLKQHIENNSTLEFKHNKEDVFKDINGESFEILNGVETSKFFFSNSDTKSNIKIINADNIAYASYDLDLSKKLDPIVFDNILNDLVILVDEEVLNNDKDFADEFGDM